MFDLNEIVNDIRDIHNQELEKRSSKMKSNQVQIVKGKRNIFVTDILKSRGIVILTDGESRVVIPKDIVDKIVEKNNKGETK